MLEPIKKIQRVDKTSLGPMLRPIDQNQILGKQEQIIDRINLLSAIVKTASLEQLGPLPAFLIVPPGEETATERLLSAKPSQNKRKEKSC